MLKKSQFCECFCLVNIVTSGELTNNAIRNNSIRQDMQIALWKFTSQKQISKNENKKTPIKYSRAVSRYSIGFFLVRYKVVTTWIDTCILLLYTCVYASSKVKVVKQRFSQKNLTWEDGICVCHNIVNLWHLYIVSAKDFKFRPNTFVPGKANNKTCHMQLIVLNSTKYILVYVFFL